MAGGWTTESGRWSAWVWVDVALAALLTVGAELELRYTPEASWRGLGHTLLMLPQTLPLAARRLRPATAAAVSLSGLLLEDLLVGPSNTASELLAAILLMYALGRLVPAGRRFVAMLALVAVAMIVHAVQLDRHENDQPSDSEFVIDLAFEAVVIGGAVAVGRFIRGRDHEKVTAVEAAVADERARIARELHDVVAHGMGVMVVQAAAAEQLLATDPAAAAQPLTTVRTTGQDALAEMRRLLGLLREGGEDRAVPQPGLAELPALVERLHDSGLPVTLTVTGSPATLATGLELSAYRIVQEALTNVLKHAGPVPTEVAVEWGSDVLRLRVHNQPGHAAAVDGAGHGLIGMRERARLYGGWVDAGRQPDGSFLVEAELPVRS